MLKSFQSFDLSISLVNSINNDSLEIFITYQSLYNLIINKSVLNQIIVILKKLHKKTTWFPNPVIWTRFADDRQELSSV